MSASYFQLKLQTWPLGIQDSREKEPQCFQMKLKGNPWYTSNGSEVNYARLLACAILATMDQHGFELVGSIDMSTGNGDDNADCELEFGPSASRCC